MNELNQQIYEAILFGALLHDIGKFVQRGNFNPKSKNHQKWGEEWFTDHLAEKLSTIFDKKEKDFIRTSINAHHENVEYISLADILSAGERIPLDKEEVSDPSAVRLRAVFEEISLDNNEKTPFEYSYPLKELSLKKEDLFPSISPEGGYDELLKKFNNDIQSLPSYTIRSFFNAFYALLQKYTSFIPSSTYRDEPDISLFDHLKTTAAIAGCLYYFKQENPTEELKIDTPAFFLVGGDISGIQNFIYKITKAQGVGGISKRLRGRSFYVNLLQNVIAKYIVEKCKLFQTNILYCGGGRFELLIPNTTESMKIIDEVHDDVNKWLLKEHGGELGLIIETIEANGEDLFDYTNLLQKLDEKIAIAKKKKFLSQFTDSSFWIEDTSHISMSLRICKVCNIGIVSDDTPCNFCQKHKEIGELLPRISHIIYSSKASGSEIDALQILFGKFGSVYLLDNKSSFNEKWLENDTFLDIQGINSLDDIKTSFYFLGNTAPVANEKFSIEEKINSEDEDKTVEEENVLSFEIIADASTGDKRIGILKMDVDFLGLIFAIGLEPKRKSISRISTLSRLMDIFFGGYLNKICDDIFQEWLNESNWKHKDKVSQIFYIVYSGGDDLLIVGPWSEIPKLARKIRDEFKAYTCNNPDINISAGIFLCKPKYPISLAAKGAGEELELSKHNGRKRITLFGDTVVWCSENDELGFDELFEFSEELYNFICSNEEFKKLPRGFVHSLIRYHKQYEKGKNLNYIPVLIYQIERNVKNMDIKQSLKSRLISDKRLFFKKITIPASYALLKSRKEE